MSRYQEIQHALDLVSPTPVDLPKLYFLGDTGAGKTTIIRKFLGTEESKFPTTRQKRTTVAPTEYVIRNGDGFDITVVLKPLSEVESYVDEILKDAIGKLYKDRQKDKIVKNIRQTSDQRFRLYYLLSVEFSEAIATRIGDLLYSSHLRFSLRSLAQPAEIALPYPAWSITASQPQSSPICGPRIAGHATSARPTASRR